MQDAGADAGQAAEQLGELGDLVLAERVAEERLQALRVAGADALDRLDPILRSAAPT